MGRAMLIIAAGAIIAVGILQLGVQGKRASIAQNSAVDAYEVEIRNKAFTAAQVTMERINESGGTWHPTANSPWVQDIDGTPIEVYYSKIDSSGTGTFAQLEAETIEIHASASYDDPLTGQENNMKIITTYVKRAMHFVPEFKGAMQFATGGNSFNFNLSGASKITGDDVSGTCDSNDSKPSIVVENENAKTDVLNGVQKTSSLISDNSGIGIDPNLSYQPVDELVARLADMEGTVKINPDNPNVNNSGKWEGDLGSPDEPGVFFVEDYAKFNANSEGYGILVVKNNATIEGEEIIDPETGELDIAGKFTFNGLVIMENAYSMNAKGTMSINGSVLVGTTENYDDLLLNDIVSEMNVDFGGTADINYSCEGEKYAQLASAMALSQNRYKRLSTYE